ncbi:MAG: aminoacyl-tRNA hydrolase [Nitrospinae bacterium]|nr:aminoacyl-tRNA hydrolase [Nitrospinota bacterium]
MKAIVGLGNYGKKYEDTRHNIGFITVDSLASEYNIRINKKCNFSLIGKGVIEGEDVIIAKPHTYMNKSGAAVSSIFSDYSLSASDLIVIHDDIDLAVGKVKKKIGGGDAGHRGIRSIIECIATGNFQRIRIGVGRPPEGIEASDYVLSPFHRDELDIINCSIEKAINLVKEIIKNQSSNEQ